MGDYAIGIDPGTETGVAIWDLKQKKFETITSCGIIEAQDLVALYHLDQHVCLYVEDARKAFNAWGNSAARAQGAGSIKRDCSIWEEFCKFRKIPMVFLSPAQKGKKVDAKMFKKLTGWTGVTNEHKRDAAMLVFGR